MIEIQKTTQAASEVSDKVLEQAIRLTLELSGNPDMDLTLRLTDNLEIRQLNRDYLGIDEATDVLSFNQGYIIPETNRMYLGDIIVSVETATQQAPENGHDLNEECVFLAIHGTLHLLGYDHDTQENKDKMWNKQDQFFNELKTWLEEY